MKFNQTRPGYIDIRFEPGDYVCLTNGVGTPMTDWAMVPESRRLTITAPADGSYFLGVREPYSSRLLWWLPVQPWNSATPLFKGSLLDLDFAPDTPPAATVEPEQARRRWWRRDR